VDTSTAGTTMATEFQKYGRRPPQSTPVQALSQALPQAYSVGAVGRLSRLPARSWSASLRDVTSITYIGVRNQAANSSSAPHRSMRWKVRRFIA